MQKKIINKIFNIIKNLFILNEIIYYFIKLYIKLNFY